MSSTRRIKIHGAGSIGNHLAHAARTLGWDVVVADVSAEALKRMERDIYPQRYGRWDDAIKLFHSRDVPSGGFDVIHIGTPPPFHVPLALEALQEQPGAILVEKPLCPPSLESAQELYQASCESQSKVFVGYDHAVGAAASFAADMLKAGQIGELLWLDVEFREHWQGIFEAHPWLAGPQQSYLGSWIAGGGASGEHSHAINLWQHFAHVTGAGRVTEVDALVNYAGNGPVQYDSACLLTLRTEGGLAGRVAQDVVTRPARKRALLQGSEGALEWINGYDARGDAVISYKPGAEPDVHVVPKSRADDFIQELRYVESQLGSTTGVSDLSLERGLNTMLVVAAAHQSERQKARVCINYSRGYRQEALEPAHRVS